MSMRGQAGMTQKADVKIYSADCNTSDLIFAGLADLEAQAIPDGWSANAFRSEAEKENGIVLYTLDENENVIGLLTAYTAADEADITNVAVKNSARKKGIAKALLYEMENIAANEIKDIFLEVRMSNIAAIGLYTSLGYEKIAVRKRFYSNPVGDAIIMKKKVSEI